MFQCFVQVTFISIILTIIQLVSSISVCPEEKSRSAKLMLRVCKAFSKKIGSVMKMADTVAKKAAESATLENKCCFSTFNLHYIA